MRNEIAEWMLSQVAPPKQAKTIVGDLLEEQLGPVKFWCSVLQTAASIAVRDPRRSVVSFTGIAIGLGFYAIFAWVISVGFNPPHPFIAVYSVIVGLLVLWQAVVRLVIRRATVLIARHQPRLIPFFWLVSDLGFYVWGGLILTWKHVNPSIRLAVLIILPCALFGSWRRWRRWRVNSSPGSDRPATG